MGPPAARFAAKPEPSLGVTPRIARPGSQRRYLRRVVTSAEPFVGLDVGKDHLDVHVRPAGTARRFADTDAGHRPLVTFLAPLAPALTVREATGGYERPAAAALAGGGRPVAVVNPARVREFATALGRRAKTDTIDAAVLAEFADTVLLTAGASAPEEHVQDCANRLIDRFGATVEHRSVREEHVSFPLPKELRVLARR